MLGEALSADPGYRGPRVPCGRGHEAVFTGYREKVIDTVPGPVPLRRAWYHCARCKHGLASRDAELGVAGASMSPGLRAISGKAAAAVPFAPAAGLLEDLAGVRLTVKRAERVPAVADRESQLARVPRQADRRDTEVGGDAGEQALLVLAARRGRVCRRGWRTRSMRPTPAG